MQKTNEPEIIDFVALGQIDDVKKLIVMGKDVNNPDKYGNYAVIVAASRNDFETLKLLVEAGAKLNVFNRMGDDALIWAVRNDNMRMKDYIEENTPNSKLKTGK